MTTPSASTSPSAAGLPASTPTICTPSNILIVLHVLGIISTGVRLSIDGAGARKDALKTAETATHQGMPR